MSEHGDTGFSNGVIENGFISPEDRLRDELEVAVIQHEKFLPAVAVLVLFGMYQAWAAYAETNRDLSRLRRLTRRIESAMAEARRALEESAVRLPGLASHVG